MSNTDWQVTTIGLLTVIESLSGEQLVVKKITDNGIQFTNGMSLSHDHVQDCCENVYAGWKSGFADGITLEPTHQLSILIVPEAGIRVNGVFVPCYNEQNGYYSSGLALVWSSPNTDTRIDISEGVEDRIF